MKNLRALLRVQRIMSFRGMLGKLGARSKLGVLLLPLLGLAFVPMMSLFVAFYIGLYSVGKTLGQGEIVLTIALTAGQMVCLTFGIFYVISAFYYSKDLPVLIPMPIRPSEIVLAKFLGILSGEYLTMAPLVAPALIVYGIFAKVGPLYWPFAVLIYLLLPVIPLVISSLLSILLMRVTNLRRNRDIWRVFGALLGLLFAVGIQFFTRLMQKNGFAADPQQIQKLIETQHNLVQQTAKFVPTSIWTTNALREGAGASAIPSFLLFLAVAIAAFLLMAWAAEKLFFGGAVGGDEVRTSGKVLSGAELTQQTGQMRAPLWALLQREIKMLNRTPTFLMTGLLPLVILPFMLVVPMIQASNAAPEMAKLSRFAGHPLVPAIGLGAILLMSAMNNLAPTAISREGKYFWISRSLPVAPRVQIQAKVLHTMIFAVLNIAVVIGIAAYLHLLTPMTLVWLVVGGLVVSAATGFAGVMIDVIRPNLRWTDPQQAMKGNMNGLFSLVMTLVLAGAGALLTLVLYTFVKPAMMPVLILGYAGLAYGLAVAAGNLADKRYVEYED